MLHTFEKAQSVLEHTHFWKAFRGFIRKTCEVARYVNEQAGVQNGSLGKSVVSTPATHVSSPFTVAAQLPQRGAVLLKAGLRAGACPHRHAEISCLLSSLITRLTTGPSTVTASTLNWPSLAHRYFSVQTHRNAASESPDALCAVPPPLAVCLPEGDLWK